MYVEENLDRKEKRKFLFPFVCVCVCVYPCVPGSAGTADVVLWNHNKILSFLVKDNVFRAIKFFYE